MITDFFEDTACKNCGYTYKLGVPLQFERIEQVQNGAEIAFLCRCNVCGLIFRKVFSGEKENGKGKDSIFPQF